MNAARGQYDGATAKRCFRSNRTYSPSVRPYRLVNNQLARKTWSFSVEADRPPSGGTITTAPPTLEGSQPHRPLHATQERHVTALGGQRRHIAGSGSHVLERPPSGPIRVAVDAQRAPRFER